MLVIRDEQMKVLANDEDNKFVEDFALHIRTKSYPGVVSVDDFVLKERIRAGILVARRYRFNSHSHLAFFITLMFGIGAAFDKQPDIQKILRSETEPAQQRLFNLRTFVLPENWNAAKSVEPEADWKKVTEATTES